MTTKNGKTIYLQVVTIIAPATGRIEIRMVPSARTDPIPYQIELGCLIRYPHPSKDIVDR